MVIIEKPDILLRILSQSQASPVQIKISSFLKLSEGWHRWEHCSLDDRALDSCCQPERLPHIAQHKSIPATKWQAYQVIGV